MVSYLLGATAGGEVLDLTQLHPSALLRDPQEITGHKRDRAASTLLPRRIGGRVHNHLADHPPARMVRVTACNQEARESLSYTRGPGLGAVAVQVSQRIADTATIIHGPRQLSRTLSRLVYLDLDDPTLLSKSLCAGPVKLIGWSPPTKAIS
jgi:hypothetical protein